MSTTEATKTASAAPARKRLGLVGRKLGMTQLLLANGQRVAVTVIEAGPGVVVQRKNSEKDGYSAVQLGFEPAKPSRSGKAALGHVARAGGTPFRKLREFWPVGDLEVGAAVRVADLFREGDRVNVTGTTKGRGFTGVIKRHRFGGFRATHGTHEFFRHGGSIGNRSYPGRVFKGKRMAGHYGCERVTTRTLRVVQVRGEENLLLVVGAIAGANGGWVEVRPAAGGVA